MQEMHNVLFQKTFYKISLEWDQSRPFPFTFSNETNESI